MNYYGQTMAMKLPFCQHLKPETKEIKNIAEAQTETGVYGCDVTDDMNAAGSGQETLWNICGSLCTVSDVIVKQLKLKDAQIGEVLVFERVGAYSVTEGIYLFLSRDLPSVLMYSQKSGVRIVREAMPSYKINS